MTTARSVWMARVVALARPGACGKLRRAASVASRSVLVTAAR